MKNKSIFKLLLCYIVFVNVVLCAKKSYDIGEIIGKLNKTDLEARCVYRDQEWSPPIVFAMWSTMGCYIYNMNAAFSVDVGIYKIKIAKTVIMNKQYKYPVFQTKENKILRFDHNDLEVQQAIKNSFSKEIFYEKWLNCCEDGILCCKNVMYETNIKPDEYCPAIWDAWTCFEKTKPDRIVKEVCSPYSYSIEGPRCHLISVTPALIWAGLMSANDGLHCWAVDDADDGFQWTNDATRLLMLIVNTLLMFHIVWVLITKVKSRTDGEKVKRTARITLYMMPLFGLPFLLTMTRPDTDSCTWEQIYFFAYYSIDGLQGLTVALLFCYFNKEVQEQLLSTYNHYTGKTEVNRRKTMTTNVDNFMPTDRKSILTTPNPVFAKPNDSSSNS